MADEKIPNAPHALPLDDMRKLLTAISGEQFSKGACVIASLPGDRRSATAYIRMLGEQITVEEIIVTQATLLNAITTLLHDTAAMVERSGEMPAHILVARVMALAKTQKDKGPDKSAMTRFKRR